VKETNKNSQKNQTLCQEKKEEIKVNLSITVRQEIKMRKKKKKLRISFFLFSHFLLIVVPHAKLFLVLLLETLKLLVVRQRVPVAPPRHAAPEHHNAQAGQSDADNGRCNGNGHDGLAHAAA
jgi:hypothetical protein